MKKTIYVGVFFGTDCIALIPVECCNVCTHPVTVELDTIAMVKKWCDEAADWKGVGISIVAVADWLAINRALELLTLAICHRQPRMAEHVRDELRRAMPHELPHPTIIGTFDMSISRGDVFEQAKGCTCRRTFIDWQDLFSVAYADKNVLDERLKNTIIERWGSLCETMDTDEYNRAYEIEEFHPEPAIRELWVRILADTDKSTTTGEAHEAQ